jgi:hypothetical protein
MRDHIAGEAKRADCLPAVEHPKSGHSEDYRESIYLRSSAIYRLKSSWVIDSNNLNASSRKFPSFREKVHSRLKMQREKTNNNNSSRDKETNREHSRIRSRNKEHAEMKAFIYWRTSSCSHYVSLIIIQLSAINYGKFIFQTKL